MKKINKKSDEKNAWHKEINIAVPHLIFDEIKNLMKIWVNFLKLNMKNFLLL